MFKKFLPQIIAMLFLAGFVAYAWQEPSSAPPGGNVEAPINVGSASQYKSGALGIGGLFRAFSDAIFDANVGIGITIPGEKLDVQGGNIKVGGTTIKGDGSVSTNLNADKLDDQHVSELRPPTGLYGWCMTGTVGGSSTPYWPCNARTPAFCTNLGPKVAQCSCLPGYEIVTISVHATWNTWAYFYACYK